MKLLIKGRGRGKSTGLIYASEATGIPILTSTQASKRHILESAHNLGCGIPEGKEIGSLLNTLLNAVIDGNIKNEREDLFAALNMMVDKAILYATSSK